MGDVNQYEVRRSGGKLMLFENTPKGEVSGELHSTGQSTWIALLMTSNHDAYGSMRLSYSGEEMLSSFRAEGEAEFGEELPATRYSGASAKMSSKASSGKATQEAEKAFLDGG